MKILSLLIILGCCRPSCCDAQILLRGYKCKYFDDAPPNTIADLYSKTDTFRFIFYSRDIMGEVEDDDPQKELALGLKLCFDKYPYFRTRDSLYIYTGKYFNPNIYYYEVYDPRQQISISVRSKNNDSLFSERSKWLLSQIRLHRKGDLYLINEKGQTGQSRDDDEH